MVYEANVLELTQLHAQERLCSTSVEAPNRPPDWHRDELKRRLVVYTDDDMDTTPVDAGASSSAAPPPPPVKAAPVPAASPVTPPVGPRSKTNKVGCGGYTADDAGDVGHCDLDALCDV